jgi:selenocysteine-specific elongation factor
MIIATAGHVDHGKTSLVRALTGVDTDRLPEEKARGFTIDLGFAYVRLPGAPSEPSDSSHRSDRILGFVDVPGHARFVKNMLAGVGNVDHALVVVAADDGVMPQTIEHVEILGLLGVAAATVAITKIDRVEEDRRGAVETDIRALLASAGIATTAAIPTSVRTGEGIAALHAHIMAAADVHVARPAAGGFRMAIDRAFMLRGIGVVVTGSVHAGTAHAGDTVTIAPGGRQAWLRTLHIHDREVDHVQAGDRCSVNLSGVGLDEVGRGAWIVAGTSPATGRIDVELRLPARASPLRHWTPAHLHIGAEDLTCRVALISGKSAMPGQPAFAALHLDRPVAAWARQAFILRDQSAQHTVAGGRIIDPQPPPRENRVVRLARLTALNAPDAETAFARLIAGAERGIDFDAFARAFNLTGPEAQALAAAPQGNLNIKLIDDPDRDTCIAVHTDHWQAVLDRIVAALAAHHRERPDLLGLGEDALDACFRPSLGKALLRRAIAELRDAGMTARQGTIVHLAGHSVQPTDAELALWQRLAPILAGGGVRPPRLRELVEIAGIELKELEVFMGRAEQLGFIRRVAANRFYPPAALAELERIAGRLAAANGAFAAADFNRMSGIGRNLTIQVLEYFDRAGLTQRRGDSRIMTDPAALTRR